MKFPKKPKFITPSLYYSALLIICQVFMPILSAQATSSTNNFTFSDYTADFYLSQAEDDTSRLRVVEEFTALFPNSNQNHGITRIIPYTNQDGKNLTMASDEVLEINVWHNGKDERPYKVEGEDDAFIVYLGDPDVYVQGEQKYRLEYEFRNVITEFDDAGDKWQELYWDTNGTGWQQRFKQLTVRLHFDDTAIADSFQDASWCYVGRYGDKGSERCQTTTIADGLQFSAQNLSVGENLSFVVTFAPETFVVPGLAYDYRLVVAAAIEVAVLIAMSIAMIVITKLASEKRRYYKGLFVKPEYTPAKDLTVADLATNYIKPSKLGSSKVATMMELAVTHKIELKKLTHTKKTGKTKYTWWITIESLDLTAAQVAVLKLLAGGTQSLNVGQGFSLESHRANTTLIQLGKDFDRFTREKLRKQGLLEAGKPAKKASAEPKISNPCNTLAGLMSLWMFIGIFGSVFFFSEVPSYRQLVGDWPLTVALMIALIGGFILSLVFSNYLSPYFTHTKKGLMYSKYLDGLGLYIKMTEKERLKLLQSVKGADTTHQGVVKVYEKLLPYAVLFKMEKSWLDEMGKYYTYSDVTEPNWYVGGAFIASDFSRAMRSMSNTMNSNFINSTATSSSGFSGAGGGGFSGGGGGGGGGGGW